MSLDVLQVLHSWSVIAGKMAGPVSHVRDVITFEVPQCADREKRQSGVTPRRTGGQYW